MHLSTDNRRCGGTRVFALPSCGLASAPCFWHNVKMTLPIRVRWQQYNNNIRLWCLVAPPVHTQTNETISFTSTSTSNENNWPKQQLLVAFLCFGSCDVDTVYNERVWLVSNCIRVRDLVSGGARSLVSHFFYSKFVKVNLTKYEISTRSIINADR